MSYRDEELAQRDVTISLRDEEIEELRRSVGVYKNQAAMGAKLSTILKGIGKVMKNVIAIIVVVIFVIGGYCFSVGASYSYITKNCKQSSKGCHNGYGAAAAVWPIALPVTVGFRWGDKQIDEETFKKEQLDTKTNM